MNECRGVKSGMGWKERQEDDEENRNYRERSLNVQSGQRAEEEEATSGEKFCDQRPRVHPTARRHEARVIKRASSYERSSKGPPPSSPSNHLPFTEASTDLLNTAFLI